MCLRYYRIPVVGGGRKLTLGSLQNCTDGFSTAFVQHIYSTVTILKKFPQNNSRLTSAFTLTPISLKKIQI